MNKKWQNIRWMFEPDGSLMDIFVKGVSMNEWEKIINLINEKFDIKFGVSISENFSKTIDKNYVLKLLRDETGKMECRTASIFLGKISLNCHFFSDDEIEFDISPGEINSIEDFEIIEKFMIEISSLIDKKITLANESSLDIPLVEIDYNNGVYWIKN